MMMRTISRPRRPRRKLPRTMMRMIPHVVSVPRLRMMTSLSLRRRIRRLMTMMSSLPVVVVEPALQLRTMMSLRRRKRNLKRRMTMRSQLRVAVAVATDNLTASSF